MKKLRNLICIMILLIICIICILLLLLKRTNTYYNDFTGSEVEEEKIVLERINTKQKKENYLAILNSLNIYSNIINEKNTSEYYNNLNNEQKQIKIGNILSERSKKNSTDISKLVYQLNEFVFYVPVTIELKKETERISTYLINGAFININYELIGTNRLLLNLDTDNQTFSIEEINSNENVSIEKIEEIIENDNNIYDTDGNLSEEIAKKYFLNYKRLSLAVPQYVYNYMLQTEYKNKKYGSMEKFKEYVNNNRENIIGSTITKYNVVQNEGGNEQIIFIDELNNYYVMTMKNDISYDLILDNYTVEIKYFSEKYNNFDINDKIKYNISNITSAINKKDFDYIYKNLDNSFRSKNYNSIEKLEKYFKNNLNGYYKIKDKVSIDVLNDIYTCQFTYLDEENNEIGFTIIMQLKEGTDFVMSFSIDE